MDTETRLDPQKLIADAVRTLLARRGTAELPVTAESKLTADLGMDSLELAELSAILEDELGHDPYSEGLVPETFGELVAYYER